MGLGFWRAVNRGRTVRWWLRARGRLARGGASFDKLRMSEGAPDYPIVAFDLRRDNPVRWPRDGGLGAAALGPLRLLPSGVGEGLGLGRGDVVGVGRWDPWRNSPGRLRRYRYVVDVAGFHIDAAARAGVLARLAANGVVVYLADADGDGDRGRYAAGDGDGGLRGLLGDELFGLMAADARGLSFDKAQDDGGRELRSIGMRRAAMREHSSWGRDVGGLPLVSILLATRRPGLLGYALASAGRQTYPKLELTLALHGDAADFDGVESILRQAQDDRQARDDRQAQGDRQARDDRQAQGDRQARDDGGLRFPVRVVRVPAEATLGAALNAAVSVSGGELLAKMDDDDCYGPEHIWDLVLARAYSGAGLVGKGVEFVYLAGADRTLHCRSGGGEAYRSSSLAGGTLLVGRGDLARVGGWRDAPRGVDLALVNAALRAGLGVYRTHGAGYVLVRHGLGHTWQECDGRFLAEADRVVAGWAPGLAGLAGAGLPAAGMGRGLVEE